MQRRSLLAGSIGSLFAPSRAGLAATIVSVRDHGAVGDGKADDTVPIARALEAASKSRGTLIFPKTRYAYRMGRIDIRRPVAIDLGGSRIELYGSAAGFYLNGSVPGFSIRNGEIWGDGVFESGQYGVLTSGVGEATAYDGFEASDLVIGKVVNGLRVDGIRNARLSRISIHGTVGTDPGRGYGIAFGRGGNSPDGNSENITVEDCDFEETTRHGLYVAGARNVTLRRLGFRRHAPTATETHYRSALVVSRSQEVTVEQVSFRDCNDECLGIDDDAGGEYTRNVAVTGVTISGSRDIAIRIGVAGVWVDGSAAVVGVSLTDLDLEISQPVGRFAPINIAEAQNVHMSNVRIRSTAPAAGGLIRLPAGPAVHRDHIVLENIVANIPADEVLLLVPQDVHRGSATLEIRNVTCTGGTALAYAGALEPTNANMRIDIRGLSRDITGSSPSIAGSHSFRLHQREETVVTNFTHGYPGQRIVVEFADGRTIVRQNIIRLSNSRDRRMAAGDRLALAWNDGYWTETKN
jgi:hypothetical protein